MIKNKLRYLVLDWLESRKESGDHFIARNCSENGQKFSRGLPRGRSTQGGEGEGA